MNIHSIDEKLQLAHIDHEELRSLALKLMEAGTNPNNHLSRNVKWLDAIGKNLFTLSIKLQYKDAEPEKKKSFGKMLSEVGIELPWLVYIHKGLKEAMLYNAFGQVIPELGQLIEQVNNEFLTDC